jgi:hypothetical protein
LVLYKYVRWISTCVDEGEFPAARPVDRRDGSHATSFHVASNTEGKQIRLSGDFEVQQQVTGTDLIYSVCGAPLFPTVAPQL